jgi:two-component system, cell cycle sensor histidine kinase and response regulator CckA
MSSEHPGRPKVRIWLVDDDPHIRSLGGELLERLGYDVETAEQGEEVLEKFRQGRSVDLVILDYHLPGMSGLEVCRRLKNLDPGIRLLVASGFSSAREIEQFKAAGAAGFLRKPFRLKEIQSQIEEIFREPSET